MYRWEITRAVLAQRVVAIVRSASAEQARATADTLLRAGLTGLEISLTTPGALDALRAVRRVAGGDAVIGAGTVLDAAAARAAVEAGARFLVAPGLDAEVIRTGHRYGLPVFPGAATPTEVVRALELGADAVKVFPASALGPRWVADVRAALPQAPLLPTGGIGVQQAPDWIAAGAVACGMGAALAEGGPSAAAPRIAALLGRLEESGSVS